LDPDPAVRTLAYRQLGDRQDPGSLELLAVRLSQEGDPGARLAAQDALGRLLLDVDALARALEHSPSPHARAWAAHALGNYPGLIEVQILLEAVDDPDDRVRREVYEALGRQGDSLAVTALTRAAVRDPSAELRRVADRAAHQVVAGRDTAIDVPTWLALLASGDPPERVLAAHRLGESGDWRVYEPLLHATASGPREVRVAAVTGLGALGDRRAVPALHDLARGAEGALRHHAIAALAHLADESSQPVLSGLLEDPDPETQRFAVRALGWLGGPGAVDAIAPALDDPALAVRTEVVQQLRDLDEPARVTAVIRALDDPEPLIRAEAVRLLGSLEGPRVEPALLASLGDSDTLVRLTGADALVARQATAAVPLLRDLVDRTRDADERALYEEALAGLSGSSDER